jgi:hypothetical protein
MIIQKKRIHNISPYLHHIKDGSKIIIGIADPQRVSVVMKRIGFLEPYERGQSILPASIGPVSYYNAEGKEIIHKDQQKETVYHSRLHHWTEWHGPYRVQQSGIVDFRYERYPRSFVEPPSVELTITENNEGLFLLTSPVFEKSQEKQGAITHAVNLFLEIFGECQFFTENLESIMQTSIKRLNWKIFPQGRMPWEQLREVVEPIIKRTPKDIQPVLYYRLQTVNELLPDFRAIGVAGFHGYIVHGFTKKNIYVLESMYYGNATYVFGETWEELSKKTKGEVLRESLQNARIIHREGWKKKVEEIIKGGESYGKK